MTDAVTLQSPDAAATPADPPAGKPFAFGSEALRPVSAIPALDRMSEHMGKRLRDALEPLARAKPRVEPARVIVQRFGAWRDEQPDFTSISLYRIKPLKGGMLIAIEPGLIRRLVDTFYGGAGSSRAHAGAEFTPVEERLLGRLSDALVATLGEVWSELKPVEIQLANRETSPRYASLVRAEEPVAIARFAIGFGSGKPASVQILYPVSSLRTVEAELSAKTGEEAATGSEWRERIADALGDVRIETRSVLARPTLSVLELLKLAPGDVIPISLPSLVPLNVGGHAIALGTIGEHDGRAALKIEKIGKGNAQ